MAHLEAQADKEEGATSFIQLHEKNPVVQHVQLNAEQQRHMHFGCVEACKPSPVESKCVTDCEAKMYGCIDHTGPNETPEDTEACQAKVLEETKAGANPEETKGKAEETKGKAEETKGKASFLQVKRNIDDDNAK